MHIWSLADFCGFGLEHAVHIHPIFPLPIEWNGMVTDHQIYQFLSTLSCLLPCGPGFDPRSGQFPWLRFFQGFSPTVRQMSLNLRPQLSPDIISHHINHKLFHTDDKDLRFWRALNPIYTNTRVNWRGSLWINIFKRSSRKRESLPKRGVSLMSKRSSLKREKHFLAVLSPMALSPYTAQYWTQWEEYVGNVQNSPLGTPSSSAHGSTHYLQMTKLQYVNSSTSIELQMNMIIYK